MFPLLLAALLQAPDPTLPAHATVVASTEARGVQVYACTQQSGAWQWVFQSPEATLFDPVTHAQLATHAAGPTWLWRDGSSATGKLLQTLPAPSPADIAWLLLAATPAGETGILTPVTLIRRSATHGGTAPATGCDAARAATRLRVPYTATYTFYRRSP